MRGTYSSSKKKKSKLQISDPSPAKSQHPTKKDKPIETAKHAFKICKTFIKRTAPFKMGEYTPNKAFK